MMWYVIRHGCSKRHKHLATIVQGQPAWESPKSLAEWQSTKGSHIYAMVNKRTAWTYVGMIKNRTPAERWHEHTRGIKNMDGTKYKKTKALGLEDWYMVPLASFTSIVESKRLKRIEQVHIKMFARSLNNLKRCKRAPENKREVMTLRH